MKKYIYLAINNLSLSTLKTKYVTTNFKEFISWLRKQENKKDFIELEAWKVENGADLNHNNMVYIGHAEQVLKTHKKNNQIKSNKK